jgi:hypothetical protein
MALFAAGAMHGCHQAILVHRPIVPSAVGGVGPQTWSTMASGHVEVCPLPSGVRSLTIGSSFLLLMMVGGSLHPCSRVIACPQGWVRRRVGRGMARS